MAVSFNTKPALSLLEGRADVQGKRMVWNGERGWPRFCVDKRKKTKEETDTKESKSSNRLLLFYSSCLVSVHSKADRIAEE
jgi:hypothetical protein